MPQELLRSAIRDPRPSQRWFMLPVSVAAHGAVAVAWFVVPLTAPGPLPVPALPSGIVAYVKTIPLPPPLARSPRPASPVQPSRPAAPTQAPPVIEPERVVASSDLPELQVDGAFPSGAGTDGALSFPGPPPPPPQVTPEPQRPLIRVGAGVREPKKIVDVAPVYPRLAQEARVQGVVVLEAVIAIDGRIDRLRVLRSTPLLDDAAVAAVKQWRYTPTLLNGVPVPVLMTITVNFRLN